jgi:hypothetical protein
MVGFLMAYATELFITICALGGLACFIKLLAEESKKYG